MARSLLVPALTVPISLVATFTVLMIMGYSINLLTLLALVMAIGLVVDDSIVVLENIHRRLVNGAELVTNGQTVRGYDPATGKQLWTLSPNSEVTVATPIIANDLIYVTGGYPPARPVYALKPGGSGDQTAGEGETNIAWSKERGGTYMPTPVAYNGRLFTCNNDGRMVVYDAVSGEQIYRARVGGGGGTFTGSPIAADGKLYFSTEEGDVFVIRADTDEYVELAHNEMDEIIMSSPAVSDGVLIVRTMKHVYGLGSAE